MEGAGRIQTCLGIEYWKGIELGLPLQIVVVDDEIKERRRRLWMYWVLEIGDGKMGEEVFKRRMEQCGGWKNNKR